MSMSNDDNDSEPDCEAEIDSEDADSGVSVFDEIPDGSGCVEVWTLLSDSRARERKSTADGTETEVVVIDDGE